MAAVFRAHDLALERTVAIKVLRSEYDASDTFRREARAIAKLPHPNIVTVFDVGHHDCADYIVMEFVEGQNLKEWIRVEAPFRPGRAVNTIIQVCEAVGFAHEQGILHCDLKPQNVLVLPNGQVKVADFGIARVLSTTPIAQNEKAWGTPHYASPELISGRPLTPASDVYSIAVMLYEMLANRLPFEGHDAVEIARQHALNAPPPIQRYNPRVPRSLVQVLDRALAKDPAKRYPTAKQLGSLLVAYRNRGESATQPLKPSTVTEASPRPEIVIPRPKTPPTQSSAANGLSMPAPGALAPSSTQVRSQQRFDWPLLLLAALAFVAVAGLVPLWGSVISRALEQPGPAPIATATAQTALTPTSTVPGVRAVPTATPQPEPTATAYASVPDLVGRPIEEAEQLARDAKMTLTIGEQRHDAQVPAQHVLAQSPPAGDRVPPETEITVVISSGPEQVVMPDVVGFPLSVKRLDLEDLGLVVSVTETWSTEPVGLVVYQEPAPDTEITVGSVVTLTISTGARSLVEANFDDKVILYAAELNNMTLRPGDILQIVITWHVLDRLPAPYTTFIHLTDADGQIAAQLDRPPLGGSRPTDTWRAGEKLLDPYSLPLPATIRPDAYWVRVGLYRGAQRLPVVDPGSAQAEQDAVLVHQVTVE
jgi:serine/threonine-protein kinase